MGLFRNSVCLIRLVLALSLLLPSFVHADPPAAAPTVSFNAPSLSGGGQGNQGTTGQSGSNSSGSGTTNGQTGSTSTGGSTRQNSSSPVTSPEDSSATQPTNSFVAPNTEDLQNDPRGIQVINLFKELLNREPNSRELADRVGDLVTNRTTLAAMRSELLASDERYKLQVNSLYSRYLGRPIDQPAWYGLVKANPRPTMDALKSALERSDEYKKRQIIDLYIKYLDRAPDPKALQARLQANAGQPLNTLQLENDLRFSNEYATQWYINAFAQRLKKCPSADEIKAIVPLLTSKKATYAQAAQGLDAQVPRDFDGSSLVVKDPIPSLCPNAFDNTSKQARTQLANYALTSVQTKISNPRDFQIADLRNRLANLRAEIEKQTSLLNGTRQNISSLKKQLDELTGLSYAVAAASGTVTATKRNLDGMRDLETEQAARLEQLQQSARTLEGIIAEFEAGGGDDDLYYSAPNERLRTVITTDASREADRKFGEELSRASYKLAIAEGGLKATQQGLVSLAVVGTVVLSGGATAPILLTAAANGSVIAFISSRSEAVGQVSAGNLTYTEAHNKATNDFLRGTGLACITAASVGTGGLTKIGVQSLSKATLARMSEGSAAYRVVYWTSPSAAFFASGSASSGVSSAVSNVPTWVSGEKSAAEVAQIIGVDTLFGGVSGLAGGNIKNPIVDAGVDLALATTQSVVKGEIDPNRPQETTEAILGNLISTATSSAVAKLQSNIEKQQKSGGTAPINNANAAQSSDAILREAITKLAPKGTLDAVMQKIQQDVLQKGDVTNVLPVDILSRIPGLDPIKKPNEYQAAVDAVSKALEQARLVGDVGRIALERYSGADVRRSVNGQAVYYTDPQKLREKFVAIGGDPKQRDSVVAFYDSEGGVIVSLDPSKVSEPTARWIATSFLHHEVSHRQGGSEFDAHKKQAEYLEKHGMYMVFSDKGLGFTTTPPVRTEAEFDLLLRDYVSRNYGVGRGEEFNILAGLAATETQESLLGRVSKVAMKKDEWFEIRNKDEPELSKMLEIYRELADPKSEDGKELKEALQLDKRVLLSPPQQQFSYDDAAEIRTDPLYKPRKPNSGQFTLDDVAKAPTEYVVMYHGTDKKGAKSILEKGIDLSRGGFEFGPGFYLTSVASQGLKWAESKAKESTRKTGVKAEATVIRVIIPKSEQLESIYNRGSYLSFSTDPRFYENDKSQLYLFENFDEVCGILKDRAPNPVANIDLVYGPLIVMAKRLNTGGKQRMTDQLRIADTPLGRELAATFYMDVISVTPKSK